MIILSISIAIGLFAAMMFWQIFQVFDEVPHEDRSLLDRPAFGFRIVWPLITVLEHYFGHRLSVSLRKKAFHRLQKAGKEFSLMPEQFIAGKIVSACIFMLVSFTALSVLGNTTFLLTITFGIVGFYYPEVWLREATAKRQEAILKQLPFYLDIITLAVEAGTNLTGGITQAVSKSGDSVLKSEFSRVLRDIRAGKTRVESLRAMADRTKSSVLVGVVSSMIQAERTGSSLGPILRAQADQIRSERFMKAEKKAMEAPVKLLGPLVLFIFPCTFLVLGFLIFSKAMLQGFITWEPLVWAYNWPG